MMSKQSISTLYQGILANNPAPYCIMLAFDNCHIAVKTNSFRLESELSHYFSSFVRNKTGKVDITVYAIESDPPTFEREFTVKQPDPGKTKVKEEFLDFEDGRVVRKRLTDMVFLFGEEKQLAVGPCEKNPNQVINFINNRFIEWLVKQGYLLAHAAGVIYNGKGLAMAGFSGMGKSTLALHMMNKGAVFVSNDRLMVKSNGNHILMEGVAKLPRINPGTALNNESLKYVIPANDLDRFLSLPKDELWDLECKFDVFIDECFGRDRFKLGSRMDGVVVLNWKRENGELRTNVTNFDERRDLLSAFMKPVGLFYEGGEETTIIPEEEYVKELAKVPVLEISGGADFEKATSACIDFLRNMT